MKIERLTDITGPRSATNFEISYCSADGGVCVQKEKMTSHELKQFLNSMASKPVFICYMDENDELGRFSYINSIGQVRRQPMAFRSCARYFLRQFIEDAVYHSVEGTGSFEVHPIVPEDVTQGWISLYYSRANQLFKATAAISLTKIGIKHCRRRDKFDDVYGTALPTYSYELTCGICLIKAL